MTDAIWWYERNGQPAGPVAHAAMVDLIRQGLVSPDARVWRSGMASWRPSREVPELSSSGAPAPSAEQPAQAPGDAPPPLPTQPPPQDKAASTSPPAQDSPAPPPPPRDAPRPGAHEPIPPPGRLGAAPAALPEGMEPVSTTVVIVLGIFTLGIYVAVRFFQAAMAYESLAGRRSRFQLYFWLSIGLGLAGGPLHLLGVLGWAAHVAAIVFAALTLSEVLLLRKDLLRAQRISPILHSDASHQGLFVGGLLTAWLVVGIVLLVVEAVRFFEDHRALAEELQARAWYPPDVPLRAEIAIPTAPPPPSPAAATGEAPAVRACAACGLPLGPAARFCERCGAAAPTA